MLKIIFKYRDAWLKGKWNTQQCECKSVMDCVKFYGLNQPDVEYEIISVEEVR